MAEERNAGAPAKVPEPIEIIESLEGSTNHGDVINVAKLFADDAELKLEPPLTPSDREVFRGRQEIEGWLRQLSNEGLTIDSDNVHVAGDRVSWDAKLRAERFRNRGLDPAQATFHAELEGAIIESLTISYSPETVQKMK